MKRCVPSLPKKSGLLMYRHSVKPLVTAAGALYEQSPMLRKKFTYRNNFPDQGNIQNWRPHGDNMMWVPRGSVPLGEDDRRTDGKPFEPPEYLFQARDAEQHRVVCASLSRSLAGENFITQSPTGSGKTYIGAAIAGQVGVSTLIVVTKEDVKLQWLQAIEASLGVRREQVGIIQGDVCSVGTKGKLPIAVAMVQSLAKWARYPSWVYQYFGLVIFDEVHRMGADQFSNAIWQLPARRRIGLSATPKRKDGRDIVFQQHIGRADVVSHDLPMIPKVLRYHTGWRPHHALKVNPARMGAVVKYMAGSQPRNALIARLAGIAHRHASNRYCVIFSDTRAHLDKIRTAICSQENIAGHKIGYYVGGMSESERKEAVTKRIVLATYKMCSEATNVPRWDTCILATPKSDVVQIVGRVLRQDDEKGEPVVFDLVDAHPTLAAMADKRRSWYLSIKSTIKDK